MLTVLDLPSAKGRPTKRRSKALKGDGRAEKPTTEPLSSAVTSRSGSSAGVEAACTVTMGEIIGSALQLGDPREAIAATGVRSKPSASPRAGRTGAQSARMRHALLHPRAGRTGAACAPAHGGRPPGRLACPPPKMGELHASGEAP